MRLWTYQHPNALQILRRGERHECRWEYVFGERWENAFRWMGQQMAERNIVMGENAPVWAWHSVRRIGGKPDKDCLNALMNDFQLSQGLDLLELEVPDHLALASCYGAWNQVLDRFIDGATPPPQEVADCFAVSLRPRRGRPPHHFPDIQACLPYVEPAWLQSWETLDTERLLEERRAFNEAARQYYEQYKSIPSEQFIEWQQSRVSTTNPYLS